VKKICLFAVLLMTALTVIYSQDTKQAEDLLKQTAASDIETSTYHELVAWCERIGLDSGGAANELRKRLYKFYGVNPSEKTSSAKEDVSQTKKIQIEKAENLDYFTIEKIDENYAVVTGGVFLTIEDSEKHEKHIIEADTIIFNFKENFITASGNIKYSLEGETKTENFRGEKITFNIEDTEGLFDRGITEQNKTIEDDSGNSEEITFYFKGDLINKTSENYVILESGEITSCSFDSPHYKIKAKKIWLLTDNEWAIADSTVYLGRIPVFYFPAFLYGGDEMFFNPSFGFNTDFGNYLQTTTYLIGQKTRDQSSPFSIMQSEMENKYYKINGLFLTEDPHPDALSKAVQDYGRDSKNYIKLLLDYYDYLGFYSALDLKLTKPDGSVQDSMPEVFNSILSVVKDTELYLSAAFAKKYETVEYPVYTSADPDTPSGYNSHVATMFPDEDGIYRTIWKNSYFLGLSLPFRYGLDFTTSIDFSWLTINLVMNQYSDKTYTSDYADRSENFDLLTFIGSDKTTTSSASDTTSSSWSAKINLAPNISLLKPYLNTLTFNINPQFQWNSEEIDPDDESFADSIGWYFYPANYNIPKFTASIKGSLIPAAAKDSSKTEKSESIMEGLRPPWEEPEPESVTEQQTPEYDLPDPQPDIAIQTDNFWNSTKAFTNTLTYTITPTFNDQTFLNTGNWNDPLEIDLSDISYSFRTASLNTALAYNNALFGKLIKISDTVNFKLDYQEHYNMDSLSSDTYDNYLLEDDKNNNFNVTNNFTLTSYPLVFLDYIQNANFTYTFNSILYEYDYNDETDEFEEGFIQNTDDYITQHKLTLNIPFTADDNTQSLTLSSTLPPLDMTASGTVLLNWGISASQFDTSVTGTDSDFEFKPLTYNQKFKFNDKTLVTNIISYNYADNYLENDIFSFNLSFLDDSLTAASKIVYNFEDSVFEDFSASCKLLDFYLNFTADNVYDYTFVQDTGWKQSEETSFLPVSLKTGISTSPDESVFWKNRIGFDYSLDAGINMNFIRFTESSLSFKLQFDLSIYKFLDIHFKSESENNSIYRYIPSYCDEVGVNTIDPVEDLIKSFNFFNIEDRYASNFNLKTITIGIEHDLHDWDLNLDYTGEIYLDETGDTPAYKWGNEVSIYLKWRAISDIKSEIEIDKGDISF